MMIFRLSLVALVLLQLTAISVATLQSNLEVELWESACALNSNRSLKYEYYSSVRSLYGDGGNPQDNDYYFSVNAGTTSFVRCYNSCKGKNVTWTWCAYIYHPKESIQICINESGVVMETPSSAVLGLSEKLSLQSCPGSTALNCLWMADTPYYLNKAYFVCTTRSSGCIRNTFEESSVTGYGKEIRITEFPMDTVVVTEGETVTLKCASSGTSFLNYIQWTHNNHTNYTAIYEDPFCNTTEGVSCGQDNTSLGLKLARIRMYLIVTTIGECIPVTNVVSYLIIDNVTKEDEGLYKCTAFSNPLLPNNSMEQSTSLSLTLQVMPEKPTTASTEISTENVVIVPSINATKGDINSTQIRVEKYNYAVIICFCVFLTVVSITVISTALLIRMWRCRPAKSSIHAENPYCHESALDENTVAMFIPPDRWRFPSQKLIIFHNKVLGKGAFGKVLLAKAEGIVPDTPAKDIVAVKTAKDGVFHSENNDLFDELELMKKLKPHENIINLLGYCITKGGPPSLIIEYAMHGSLRSFLKSCKDAALSLNHQPVIVRSRTRTESCSSALSSPDLMNATTPTSCQAFLYPKDNSEEQHPSPADHIPHHTPQRLFQDSGYGGSTDCYPEERVARHGGTATPLAHTLVPITHDYVNCKGLVYMEDVENFALQIASGLKHLSEMEIVHCDLAARNILIGDGFTLKISDFGMARDVSGKEYYRKNQKGHIPVKWTSPEALEESMYTYKSDIWSFGVVLWEIFTYGETPYPDVEINTVKAFIQHLKDGNRLPRPDGCPESMYNIMQLCWSWDPEHRPLASKLVDTFVTSCYNQTCSSTFILRQSQELVTPEEISCGASH